MLVVTATPALAAALPNGFNGGGDTVTVTTTVVSGTTYYVEFQPAGTCAAAAAFAGTPSTVATATGTTSLDVKVPPSVKLTSTRASTYQICIYAISALSTLVDGATTYTANIFDLVLDTGMTAGPNNGGNVITAKTRLPTGASGAGTPVSVLPPNAGYPAQFQVEAGGTACAATYVSGNGPTVTASNLSSSVGNTLSLTVPTGGSGTFPTTVPKVTAAVPGADYNVCVYNGTATGSVLIAGTDNGSVAPYRVNIFSLTPLTPSSGPSGGGNTIVATMPTIGLPSVATYYTQFQVGTACADTAAASSSKDTTATATGGTALSVPVPDGVDGSPGDVYRVCVYAGTATAAGSLLAQSTGAYTIAAYGLALSTYATGLNSTNVTVTGTLNGGTITTAASVQFYTSACAATYTTPATSGATGPFDGTLTLINSTRAAIAVPATVTANQISYTVCIYAGSTNGASALIATAATPYTIVGASVTITAVDVNAGPAQGGTVITLTGTFPASPAALTVMIGGVAATVTLRTSTTGVTATVPAHTPGTFPIVVTTAAGPVINAAVTYTYSYGITVTPQSAPSLPVATAIDVRGVGFLSLTFTDTTGTVQTNNGAHVYLVAGKYDPSLATGSTTAKKNGQVAECVGVRVVSDSELVCTLYLGGNTTGYTRTFGGAGCNFTGASTALTSTATCPVTAADIGSYISASGGTGGTSVTIAAGTTITAVSGTAVTLSKTTGGTGTLTGAATVLTTVRDVTSGFSAAGTTLTSTSTTTPVFTSADQGKVVVGTGVPDGTTITSVNTAGVATVSSAITGTGLTSVHLYMPNYNTAVDGVYTITVVNTGALAPTTYSASVISSGSTFTVAAYRRR
jgi:hypothetical protein